jgi:hypothetical protein
MEKQVLLGETVFVVRGFLSPAECSLLIEMGESMGFGEAPITTFAGFVMRKDVRDNARVIHDSAELAAAWWERAQSFLPERWFGRDRVGLNERFRFYRYDPGQKFAPHTDGYFERSNGERSQFTFMVYLNGGVEGGTTNFHAVHPPLRVVPETGMALVFAHKQLHEGAPVVRGRKYVLRTDVMYGPYGSDES